MVVRYRYGKRSLLLCAAAVALVCSRSPRSAADDDAVPASSAKSTRPPAPIHVDARAALARARLEGTQWVAHDASDRRIELTLSPRLQERAERLFRQYRVPHGGFAAIEPSSGRVLAYVSYSSEASDGHDIVRDASPPAASVFKLVTASALVEAGVAPSERVCYSGGSSRLDMVNLQDNPRRDSACARLDEALGRSINSIFAKLADRHLDAGRLLRYARAFGFGRALHGELVPPPSPVEVPGDRLEFARTAAGFWHTHMSPLHAALIAATVANAGAMPQPYVVERVLSAGGKLLLSHPGRGGSRRVIKASTARTVGRMMQRTVREGTSRSAFVDERGRPVLPGIDVAGKTGSLSENHPYRAYSWWVGFAPADKPRIALAALVVNKPVWRIKSSYVARELLREYLITREREQTELAHRDR